MRIKAAVRKKRAPAVRPAPPSPLRLGYLKGRQQGYPAGLEAGRTTGYQQMHYQYRHAGPALVIAPAVDMPSLEIMVLQPFRLLAEQKGYSYTVKTEDEVQPADVQGGNPIIFLRTVEPKSFELMQLAHKLGKKTVYCIDDNFLEVPENTEPAPYYQDAKRRETFVRFLSQSGVVKVDSPYFADYIKQYFNPRVVYFPSSVDFAWIEQAGKAEREDGLVVIGYEGTQKEEDFAPVVPALQSVLNEYGGRVRLQFYGFIPEGLSRHPWVAHWPIHQDYRGFVQTLYRANWDIGIAPLADTVFNYCKTNNKFREYSACWIPGIYSEAPAYRECVAPGETGLLVPQTTEGWYSGLRQLIDQPELRERIKARAGAVARQRYTIQASADQWSDQILRV